MKTLIIHPKDITTDFLCATYDGLDVKVIRDPQFRKSQLRRQIKAHDRIIMMGHGMPYGLLAGGNRVMIDSNFVNDLRNKTCIGIWCYAGDFFTKYGLSGWSTGMFISEESEAIYEGVHAQTQQIDQSNEYFSKLCNESDFDFKYVSAFYRKFETLNPIVAYNHKRLSKHL